MLDIVFPGTVRAGKPGVLITFLKVLGFEVCAFLGF